MIDLTVETDEEQESHPKKWGVRFVKSVRI